MPMPWEQDFWESFSGAKTVKDIKTGKTKRQIKNIFKDVTGVTAAEGAAKRQREGLEKAEGRLT